MKTILFLATLIAGFSSQALAENTVVDEKTPYIAPSHCGTDAKLPPNANPAMYSKNCQYAFVLPPLSGQSKLVGFTPSQNLALCKSSLESRESIHESELTVSKLKRKRSELVDNSPDDPRITVLGNEITQINTEIKEGLKNYAGVHGANIEVSLTATSPDETMNEWRNANSQMIDIQHTVFAQAPIADGYISFNEVNATEAERALDPAVLKSSIPGFRRDNQASPTVVYNGSMNGSVELSLSSACGMLENLDFKNPHDAKIDEVAAASNLVANYTYSVPVRTGVAYTASIHTDEIISSIQKVRNENGQFTVNQLLENHINQDSGSTCDVKFTKYELDSSDTELQSNFEKGFATDVCSTFIISFLDKLKGNGLLASAITETAKMPETVKGGNVEVKRSQYVCHEKKALGIVYSRSCGDEEYTALEWHNGLSTKDALLDSDLKAFAEQNVSYESTLFRWNTMSFLPVANSAKN